MAMTMIAAASRPAPHRPAALWNPSLMAATVAMATLGMAAGLAGSPLGTIFEVPRVWAQGLASASALGLTVLVGWVLWAIYGPPRLMVCAAVVALAVASSYAVLERVGGPWALGASLVSVMVTLAMVGWVGWTLGTNVRGPASHAARMW